MSQNGYIRLHRKVLDSWQGTRDDWAWIWIRMLLKAEYQDCPSLGLNRGQFFSSLRQIAKESKKSVKEIRIFVAKAEAEGDLLWERGVGGTAKGTDNGTAIDPGLSRFSIVKYDCYNSYQGTAKGTAKGTLLSSSSNRKKKKEIVPDSSESDSKKTETIPRDLETLRKLLEGIDRKKIQEQFPDVDVRSEWSKFQRDILEGTPKYPHPNPFNWKGTARSWQAGFRNWCENARKWGGVQTPIQDVTLKGRAYKPFKGRVVSNGPEINSERKMDLPDK